LQPGTDGLGDTSTTGLLRLFKKRERNLYCNLPRGIHNACHHTIFEASIGYGVSARPLKIHKGCETQLAKNSPTLLQNAQKEWATQRRVCGSRGGHPPASQAPLEAGKLASHAVV